MLQQVLKAVENSDGPVRLRELSRQLNIDPAVLDGMLEFWIRKGKIRRKTGQYSGCDMPECPAGCQRCAIKPVRRNEV